MKRTDEEILAAYIDGYKLKVIPAKHKKKLVILRWLVQRFTPDVRYTESEVNRLISESHPDFATLRRELYDNFLLERRDGVYWRPCEQYRPKTFTAHPTGADPGSNV